MTAYLLLEGTEHWHIGVAGSPAQSFETLVPRRTTAAELTSGIMAFCSPRGQKADLLIGLHATSVVSMQFAFSGGDRNSDRRAMLFQMEPSLPFDAENATADFVGTGSSRLGVAAPTDRLLPLIREIESRGVLVQSIFPAAIGAAQCLEDQSPGTVWRNGGAVDLIERDESGLRSWSHLPDSPQAVNRTLKLEEIGSPLFLDDPEFPNSEFGHAIGAALVTPTSLGDYASTFAAHVYAGNVSPWIELRRGTLANGDPNRPFRKSLNWLMVAAGALCLLFSIACWNRGTAYEEQATNYAAEQRKLFRTVFPGSRTNAPISRLRSEYARAMGSRDTNTGVKLPVSAVGLMADLVPGIPSTLKVKFTQIRIEDGNVDLQVEVRTYADISRFEEVLNASGFRVTSQTQEQLEPGRVSATFTGPFEPTTEPAADQGGA